MTIIDHERLDTCPSWCTVDHEKQQRELDVRANFSEDRDPFHHRTIIEGVDTDTHGPIYSVAIERSSSKAPTRLWVAVESLDMTADQAEAFGLAIVRGANILRTCPDAAAGIVLRSYQDVDGQNITFEPEVFESTAAERALGSR